jgi:hypothetical protein
MCESIYSQRTKRHRLQRCGTVVTFAVDLHRAPDECPSRSRLKMCDATFSQNKFARQIGMGPIAAASAAIHAAARIGIGSRPGMKES